MSQYYYPIKREFAICSTLNCIQTNRRHPNNALRMSQLKESTIRMYIRLARVHTPIPLARRHHSRASISRCRRMNENPLPRDTCEVHGHGHEISLFNTNSLDICIYCIVNWTLKRYFALYIEYFSISSFSKNSNA